MIYEYALDPELVASWGQLENYRKFYAKFGLKQRRIISRFPKKWDQLVKKSFYASSFGDQGRILEIIGHLTDRMVLRDAPVETDWLQSAEKEHDRANFCSIIAASNPRSNKNISLANDYMQLDDVLEDHPFDLPIRRTPNEMSNAIAPMLKCASHVAFIDPYFHAGRERFRKPLEEFMTALISVQHRCVSLTPAIELHTSIERYFKEAEQRDAEEEIRCAGYISDDCKKYLPRIIPKEFCLKVVIWKNKPNGDRLHNRYVYTDIGSVRFGVGLDCFDTVDVVPGDEQGPTDEINCCSEDTHKSLWNKYLSRTPSFQLVIPAIEIQGRK